MTARAINLDVVTRLDPISSQERRIGAAVRRFEAIPETLIQPRLRCVIGEDWDRSPHCHPKRTKIINPMNVVGVWMGKNDAVDLIDSSVNELRSQVWTSVDKDTSGRPRLIGEPLDKRCGSGSSISGL